ncbi:hypothetical protein LJE86_18420 [bacterium BMS3Abin03]|nr:hypothetical protein [bacterium BMS3Abin03]
MKIILLFSSIILFTLIGGCSKSVEPTDDSVIKNYTGTITENFLINSDVIYKGHKEIFFPSNLPKSFKQEGLKVIFSGKRIECPPNAQCLAQEIFLSSIKKL